MSFLNDLQAANKKAGGSHLTIQAREGHLRGFAKYCRENGFQIQRVDQIKEKHIRGFMKSLESKNGERTRQNKLASLRVVIRTTGKTRFAEGIKTNAMGVKSASRDGTKRAITGEEYREVLSRVADKGVAAAIQICRELGLRRTEAVMADANTLKRWLKCIESGQRVEVVRGTKGGRRRETIYPSQSRARDAVANALHVARENGGYLIKTQQGGLKGAVKRFENLASRCGLRGKVSLHSLRYAFARERMDQLQELGYTRREAAILVSIDLGHGDGRGAYIEQVYARS